MKQIKKLITPAYVCILAMSLSLTSIPHSATVIVVLHQKHMQKRMPMLSLH